MKSAGIFFPFALGGRGRASSHLRSYLDRTFVVTLVFLLFTALVYENAKIRGLEAFRVHFTCSKDFYSPGLLKITSGEIVSVIVQRRPDRNEESGEFYFEGLCVFCGVARVSSPVLFAKFCT